MISISREASKLIEEKNIWGAFLTFTEDFTLCVNLLYSTPFLHIMHVGAALSTGCEDQEDRIGISPLRFLAQACCWVFSGMLAVGHILRGSQESGFLSYSRTQTKQFRGE